MYIKTTKIRFNYRVSFDFYQYNFIFYFCESIRRLWKFVENSCLNSCIRRYIYIIIKSWLYITRRELWMPRVGKFLNLAAVDASNGSVIHHVRTTSFLPEYFNFHFSPPPSPRLVERMNKRLIKFSPVDSRFLIKKIFPAARLTKVFLKVRESSFHVYDFFYHAAGN